IPRSRNLLSIFLHFFFSVLSVSLWFTESQDPVAVAGEDVQGIFLLRAADGAGADCPQFVEGRVRRAPGADAVRRQHGSGPPLPALRASRPWTTRQRPFNQPVKPVHRPLHPPGGGQTLIAPYRFLREAYAGTAARTSAERRGNVPDRLGRMKCRRASDGADAA